MYQYKLLTDLSFKDIHKTFQKAFADYVVPFQLTRKELSYMTGRRGYRADLSFGAFRKDELVGYTLNGIGTWNGTLTAYDTGTGIVPEHRKKGLAETIFLKSIPLLKGHGIRNYLLEVIDTNTPAIKLYKKMGFKETRRFDFQTIKINDLNLKDCDDTVTIQLADILDWKMARKFWNNDPSWQNSIESIHRKKESFAICAAQKNNQLAGYGVIQKSNGDIPQLAVHKSYRKQHIASSILAALSGYSKSDSLRFINTIQSDTETRKFLDTIGIIKQGGQLEMIKKL